MSFDEDAFMRRLDEQMRSLSKRLEEQAAQSMREILAQQQLFLEEMYHRDPPPPVAK